MNIIISKQIVQSKSEFHEKIYHKNYIEFNVKDCIFPFNYFSKNIINFFIWNF